MYKKLISENLFEFQKGLDPADSLGIGRRKPIKDWLDLYNVKNYIINDDDYTIDVKGDVDFEDDIIEKLPEFIQFNNIYGTFAITLSYLNTLRGCPHTVHKDFYCAYNSLTSLEFCPSYVGGSFFCLMNNVKFKKSDVKKLCKVKGKIYN